MTHTDVEHLQKQVDNLKLGIREIVHDISNPLGVLRMAVYYLQVGNLDQAKRDHYLTVINQTIDRVEANLKKLRALVDNPLMDVRDGGPS